MVVAPLAEQPGETVGWIAASLEPLQLAKHEARQGAAGVLEIAKEEGQTFAHDLVEQIASRSAALDGSWHEDGESKARANAQRPDIGPLSDGGRRRPSLLPPTSVTATPAVNTE